MTELRPISPLERASVERLLAALCEEHGISPEPALEWSRRLRRVLGKAYHDRRLIRLSAWLDHGQAQATLRHELAHVAVGRGRRPHGPRWQAWAVKLGADPRATAHTGPALAPESTLDGRRCTGLECPGCGIRIVRFRVLRGLYCRACGPKRGMLSRAVRGPYAKVAAWARGDG